MAKQKTKYGKVELGDENFDNANAMVRVSMMLPLNLIEELKVLSLTKEHAGKYQVLIRDVLLEWAEKHHQPKRRRA